LSNNKTLCPVNANPKFWPPLNPGLFLTPGYSLWSFWFHLFCLSHFAELLVILRFAGPS
jgi:hypothetical protein